jgi:hypothetical protein
MGRIGVYLAHDAHLMTPLSLAGLVDAKLVNPYTLVLVFASDMLQGEVKICAHTNRVVVQCDARVGRKRRAPFV